MRIDPVAIIGSLVGLALKWIILFAAALLVHDMIKFKKEERHV